jgi:hypothetical protein
MPTNATTLVSLAKEVFPDLSEAEESFLRLNAVGKYPVFGDATSELDKPENADQWGPDRTIRADYLQWLCRTQNIHPLLQSIRLRGVGIKIQGTLHLDYALIPFVLVFDRSCFTDWITFEKSRLGGLELKGTWLKKSIYAAGLTITGSVHFWNDSAAEGQLFFDGAIVSGDLRCDKCTLIYRRWPEDIELAEPANEAFRGAGLEVKGSVSFMASKVEGGVCLHEAKIGSGLRCEGARFINRGKTALSCTGARIGGAVYLDRGFSAQGTVDFNFAKIGGELACRDGEFEQTIKASPTAVPPPALSLDYAQVTGSVVLTNKFVCHGILSLQGATIGGHLDCEKGRFLNQDPHCILANNAKISGGVLLRSEFHSEGTVRFFGATVGGNVECNGVLSPGSDSVALDLQRLEARGHVLFGNSLVLKGTVKFHSARIAGNVLFDGGTAENEIGYTVELNNANVTGTVAFLNNFKSNGSVSLVETDIGGNLECLESQINSPIDPKTHIRNTPYALHADFINVGGRLVMAELSITDGKPVPFVANGGVSLAYARIAGSLFCRACHTSRDSMDLFSLEGARVDGDLLLANLSLSNGRLILQRSRVRGALGLFDLAEAESLSVLDLQFASVSIYDHFPDSWPKSGSLLLDGFKYSTFGRGFSADQCIRWLRLNKPFRLQPYEQAARVLRSSGYESEATQILIAKSEDLLRYGELTWWSRLIKRCLGFFVGHGYQPHRALIFMVYIIFLGAGIFYHGKIDGLMVKTNIPWATSDANKSKYPKFQPFIYSMDTFLPIVDLGQKNYWAPNASSGFLAKFQFPWSPSFAFKLTGGDALRIYLVLYIILGWTFTTLWVAGFTGLVRKLN